MDSEPDVAPESLFRPVKRRKFMRKRPNDDTDNDRTNDAGSDRNSCPREEIQSTGQNDEGEATEVVRLRRPPPARKGGIGFSTKSRLGQDETQSSALASAEDLEQERIQAMRDRFTGHTGQMVDVDKHMMAYIDSQMAKRYHRSPHPTNQEVTLPTVPETGGANPTTGKPEPVPASLGKLHEIDLGQETKLRNIARTEAARRRLAGEPGEDTSGDVHAPSTSAGPSDKQGRHRKRRTSADLERDRLVEEVMRESKLDVYDEPDDDAPLDDQAADDRIAEQFRRDFLDAIQSRRVARKSNPKAEKDKAEVPKGPKLGGSRSARAAMREMQTKPGPK